MGTGRRVESLPYLLVSSLMYRQRLLVEKAGVGLSAGE